jgi:cyanophycin synthetase
MFKPVGTSAPYVTTKDAYTLTDGPTIFISNEIEKISKFCIQQSNIPSIVMDDIMRKIEYNNVLNEKLNEIEKEIEFQTENVLAAVAAAWAINIPWETIAVGLSTFINDIEGVPGRFNVFDYRGSTLIADYGHNPDAIQALVKAVENMPATKRVVVISGAGDRRDEDIRDLTRILGNSFDNVILYQDACQRGREDGEVLKLLQEGLVGATKAKNIKEIHGEFVAIDTALNDLSAGDICLILIDQVEESLAYLKNQVRP